ncbi:hypothetical protein CH35J_003764 [Colletotrichum higginsianum]|uniref:Uncharacterized protein n=1 Tax=Colletotrichum higginsianum TaxID=80884 RepID=A0A4T0WAP1_9PEZI|nr:hypothetical protein CH35J_003764 [Colletotrichum higginsianum]
MAPNPLCLVWREQIIDNLRLISGRSALIDVYTSRHPNKSYTIYAVKVHRGKRQEILSATGRDLEDAFENLHTKSSQEVYQFIDANGFAFPRGVKSVSGSHEDDESDSSNSEASTVEVSDILSVSAVSDDSDGENGRRRAKKTKGSSHRAPAASSKPVRLIIKWRGHGEKKVIETCVASHRALQRTALAHVRSHWQTFENVIPQEMTPGRLWGLGAKVRRVALGKDLYAISATGGDDLGMYFKAEDIPKFEVEVDHDGSIMPPPPHPHSQQ